jgi:hypothetical protein
MTPRLDTGPVLALLDADDLARAAEIELAYTKLNLGLLDCHATQPTLWHRVTTQQAANARGRESGARCAPTSGAAVIGRWASL